MRRSYWISAGIRNNQGDIERREDWVQKGKLYLREMAKAYMIAASLRNRTLHKKYLRWGETVVEGRGRKCPGIGTSLSKK